MAYGDTPDLNPYQAPVGEIGPGKAFGAGYTGYAGFWLRFVAFFIDQIITGIAGIVLGFGLGIALVSMGQDVQSPGIQAALNLVGFLIGLCYFAGMESSASQATLGKMALGLKVTDLNGNRISLGRAVGRFFSKIISALILLIGFIMAAFTERKQALHDMIAGTLVVKAR